jgi:hypothetical protein
MNNFEQIKTGNLNSDKESQRNENQPNSVELAISETSQLWKEISRIIHNLKLNPDYDQKPEQALIDDTAKARAEREGINLISKLVSDLESLGCKIVFETIGNSYKSNLCFVPDQNGSGEFQIRLHPEIRSQNDLPKLNNQEITTKLVELFRQRTIALFILNSAGLTSFTLQQDGALNPNALTSLQDPMDFNKYKLKLKPDIIELLKKCGFPINS